MIKKWLFRSTVFIGILLISACTLPVVTPSGGTITPTETSSFTPPSSNPSPTTAPIPAPVEINARNASALIVVNKSAVSNVQQLKWANDSLKLVVSTQNSDAAGAQLFGLTVLSVPDFAPLDIYTTQNERVADIASDGKKAAMVSIDMGRFTLIDLSAENATLFSITPEYFVGNVTFSPDASKVAVSKMDAWEVVLYSASDGSEIKTLTGFETAAPVYQAGFKESPQWMIWWARATLQLQEIETGKFGPPLSHTDFITTYTLTSDGSIITSIASKMNGDVLVPTITLWDAAQGIELRTLELDNPAQCLGFSPNGSLLAVGVDSTLQIWDVTSGTMIASLEGHAGMIYAVAFSPDGKYLASAGQDNQLYLWQVSE